MSRQVFMEDVDTASLSPLKNFLSLDDAIRCGGQRAERAQRIIAQFANTTVQRASNNGNNSNTFESDTESTALRKKPRSFPSARRFKR